MAEDAKVKVLMTLHPNQLAAVRKLSGLSLSVNSNTTPLEAGMQLGMARVLNILQEGFTVDSSVPNTNDG
ncbi:hypothetical protein P4_00022 [Xanthomonas phage P4]|uniref:Uncharacterized protein n=3 Tax=Pradovirus TaxID=1985733 RepID=A0AAE8YJ37_9CAUD|nr:hypothetical protein [Xanthomonas phage MUD8-T1]UGL62974.1 hypothetical protein [Xanthomonas phage R3-22-T1]WAX24042.1 hypothetical protein F5_00026 [Xanthomonas phage F5]WAX24092.1 hypothetical protein GF2_00026 [Xanthomonas phage GF2]WAX24146.1 hypothetical protein GF1_00033 [Xanthomonas phage GF1]WAX24180.1 hypothetical protein P4_00022 [Xanthomonas phage P4]WAX24232.1 hypothetical protein S3_00027 [Xanthomonas phage S3]